ncbi:MULTISPECIES: hypothetical protein [Shewanella]|uniref:hypothetical protein n=1 Tax=Shewanella TaxID=22 RepID=UPI00201ACA1B|nr:MULTISPECIES: hypothetical protein [Shewanella]
MQLNKFSIFADYFQFYLMDDAEIDDTSEIWTDKALDIKLGMTPHALAVGTMRNVDVDVIVEVVDAEPEINLDEWDYISKGYISLPSGRCIVMGCTDAIEDATRLEVKLGNYAALAMAKGINSIVAEWEPANDLYRVVIWASDSKEYFAVKEYQNT